jgi:hypothetical protein
MKKLILLIAMMVTAPKGHTMTYLEKLGELFNQGTQPNLEILADTLWIGRCFLSNSPNTAKGGAYLIRKMDSYESLAAVSPHLSREDYFDKHTLSRFMKDAVDNRLSFLKMILTPDSSLAIDENGRTFELKISGEFLVLEGRASPKAGPIGGPDEMFVRCYYFFHNSLVMENY